MNNSGLKFALKEIESVLAPEHLAVQEKGGRAEDAAAPQPRVDQRPIPACVSPLGAAYAATGAAKVAVAPR